MARIYTNELAEELRQILGLPKFMYSFKIEWTVDEAVTVTSKHYLDNIAEETGELTTLLKRCRLEPIE